MEQKNIIFVTELKALNNVKATSTHIMTYNLLEGLKSNKCKIQLVAFYEGDDNQNEEIKNYYSKVVDKVFCIKSVLGKNKGKYSFLFKLLKGVLFYKKYKKYIPTDFKISKDTILIAHAPSLESIFFSNVIAKKCIKYVQYWSDPVALSGINIEDYNIKRSVHKFIEARCLKLADIIVYGTEPLYEMQSRLFKRFASKMCYIDVSYCDKERDDTQKNGKYIYAGNYYASIRNIKPLYNAFKKCKSNFLDIYGASDVQLESTPNIKVFGRVSPEELEYKQNEYSVEVCLLNSRCTQIPGKIFYSMNHDKKILIILDGKHGKDIGKYLQKYNRFLLCENNEDDIINVLNNDYNYPTYDYALDRFSPENVAKDFLNKIDKNE